MEQPRTAVGRVDADKRYSFWIALVLVGGFLILIAMPALRGDIASATELAAIFAGWIAAIVGFYFIQGQAQQAAVAARDAGREEGGTAFDARGLVLERYKRRNAVLENRVRDLGETLEEMFGELEGEQPSEGGGQPERGAGERRWPE